METDRIARWAFIAFVVIAIVMGLVVGYMFNSGNSDSPTADEYVTLVLLILGIIFGLVTLPVKEVQPFLMATIALVVAGLSVGTGVWTPLNTDPISLLSYWATGILKYLAVFAAPAAVIVALKAMYGMEKAK
jgi:hypothetical protein